MSLRFLVVEGNTQEGREAYRSTLGATAGETFAQTLRAVAPGAVSDICLPADTGANVPDAAGLEGYDGVFVTGSALNVYDAGPAVARQVELARAVFRSRVPFYGSCWGLQVAAAASGGDVFKNRAGREIGVARKIALNAAGRAHPMLAGRRDVYDALCTHIDVVTLPAGGVTLAGNANSPVQAAEIVHDGGKFWGVQYHPEYTLKEVASIIERRTAALVREGLARDEAQALAFARDLRDIEADAARADVAWRCGLDADVLDPAIRRLEIANFVEFWVKPEASRRGRG